VDETISFSTNSVIIPVASEVWLQAFIVEGWGEIPTVLLTNIKIDENNRISNWRIVECYFTRCVSFPFFRNIQNRIFYFNLYSIGVLLFNFFGNSSNLI
jgi:hypothetical protein